MRYYLRVESDTNDHGEKSRISLTNACLSVKYLPGFCHHKGGPEWTLTLVVTVPLCQRITVPPYGAR